MAVISARWKLPEELISLSEGKNWQEALREWRLDYVEMLSEGEDFKTCLCHHYPIREVCHIVNVVNNKHAVLGNCCVTKLSQSESGYGHVHKIFAAFKKIQEDICASANKELIKYAYNKGAINDKESDFYLNIWRKRKITELQEKWKEDINRKIVLSINSFAIDQRYDAQAAQAAPLEEIARRFFGRLRENPTEMAYPVLVNKAYEKGLISEKDYNFYTSLFERRVHCPSLKQNLWIADINVKILRGTF